MKHFLAVTIALATCCVGCVDDPDAPKPSVLDQLVAKHATREEIGAALRGAYTWYAPGTDAWSGLLDSLQRDGPDYMLPVQKAVVNKRKIMFHTTAWQQTWIFLDDAERMDSYWITSQ